jgi:hypothetical protein
MPLVQIGAMSVLLCTSKYRTVFGLPENPPLPETASHGLLGPWYANTLNVGPQRYLHYMSSRTLLPIIIWRRESRTAEKRMRAALQEMLAEFGVRAAAIAAEIEALTEITYARASDRSRLASMRDQTVVAKTYIRRARLDPSKLTADLVIMPAGPMDYQNPRKATIELLGREVGVRLGGV